MSIGRPMPGPTASPSPSPSPTLKASYYFVAKNGTLTDLAPYTAKSPFPISQSTYPKITFRITNLGNLTTAPLIVYLPLSPCYAGVTVLSADTVVAAKVAFPFTCLTTTRSGLGFKVGATLDTVYYITEK